MNNLNSILLEGNLTKDPEISKTKNGIATCNLTVATNRSYKEENKYEQEVSYFDVKAYGKLAEVSGEYLKKGRGVRIIGRIKQDRWKDDDGKNHSRVVVMADHIEFQPERKKVDQPVLEEGKNKETEEKQPEPAVTER